MRCNSPSRLAACFNFNPAPRFRTHFRLKIMTQPTTTSSATLASHNAAPTLYPQLESKIAPLDESENYFEIIKTEKELVAYLKEAVAHGNPLEDVGDCSILPTELLTNTSKIAKPKVDPLKRLKELPTEEVEEEEEPEDEEEEDEEAAVEDEEDDAGGDYLVSHFDNGEGYEDNDDEDDEMAC